MWRQLDEPVHADRLDGGAPITHHCDACGETTAFHEAAVTSAVATALLAQLGEIRRLFLCSDCGAEFAVEEEDLAPAAPAGKALARQGPREVAAQGAPGPGSTVVPSGGGGGGGGGGGFLRRLGRLFRGGATRAVEQAIDPRLEVDQLVLDMDEQLKRSRGETQRMLGASKVAQGRLAELDREVTLWSGRAEQAVLVGDDELAKAALLRKAELEEKRGQVQVEQAHLADAAERMRESVRAMEVRLRDAKLRQGTLKAKLGAQKTQTVQAEALSEFERMAGKIDDQESEVEAVAELAREGQIDERDREVERKLAALDRGPRRGGSEVDDRLAALKRKMQEK